MMKNKTFFLFLRLQLIATTPQEELETQYGFYCSASSDINEHLPQLRDLAKQCSSVTEIGIREIVSTWGIVQGLSESTAPSRSYLGIDLMYPPLNSLFTLDRLAQANGIDLQFLQANDFDIDIEPTDMLFIDSWHTYRHLTYELEKFSPKVRKFIGMHDTSEPWGDMDEPFYLGKIPEYPAHINPYKQGLWPAVEDFLASHPEWKLKMRLFNNHGFTVLERRETTKPVASEIIDLVGGGELEYYWFNLDRLNAETGHEFKRVTPTEFYDPNYLLNAYFNNRKIVLNHDYGSIDYLQSIPPERLILFQWEPLPISPEYMALFSKVYTYNDDLVDNQKIFKLYYPYKIPMKENPVPFDQRKLSVMVVRNWQPHRINIVKFFDSKPEGDFDFYCYKLFFPFESDQKNYKGEIEGHACSDEKIDVLQQYKFYFCTESTFINGYVSDKIFFCFGAGLVPIYYGAPNIDRYIPKNCYIDYRSFKDEEELYQFIKTMPEETYNQYIKNIKAYLDSDAAKLFTSDTYYQIMNEAVNGT